MSPDSKNVLVSPHVPEQAGADVHDYRDSKAPRDQACKTHVGNSDNTDPEAPALVPSTVPGGWSLGSPGLW